MARADTPRTMTRRLRLGFCLLLGAAGLASAPARAEFDREAMMALSASVVKIEAPRVQQGYSLGSGVVVGAERVVTNCHVTRDAREIRVVRGESRWIVKAQTSDIYHDLCLLQVPGLKAEPVKLGAASRLAIGQPVTALGYTGGLGLQASAGEVLALHRMDGSTVVRSSNFFNSGASGGGLFDDDRKLVGILTFRLRGGEAHYFAAPTEWLARQLDERGEEVKPADPARLAFWQGPLDGQPPFLRAQVLVRDGNWNALEPLANGWAHADASDPEPWYLLGVALAQLDHAPQARRAFECSLLLEPTFSAARMRLATLDASAAPRGDASAASQPCVFDVR